MRLPLIAAMLIVAVFLTSEAAQAQLQMQEQSVGSRMRSMPPRAGSAMPASPAPPMTTLGSAPKPAPTKSTKSKKTPKPK